MSEVTDLHPPGQQTTLPSPISLVYTYLVPPDPDSSWCWGLGGSSLLLGGALPKRRKGFLKGVNWGFLFWVSLFCTGKSDSMRRVICSMCRVCATSRQPWSPNTGNNFRSPSFNELPSWVYLVNWKRHIFTLCLVKSFHLRVIFFFWILIAKVDIFSGPPNFPRNSLLPNYVCWQQRINNFAKS